MLRLFKKSSFHTVMKQCNKMSPDFNPLAYLYQAESNEGRCIEHIKSHAQLDAIVELENALFHEKSLHKRHILLFYLCEIAIQHHQPNILLSAYYHPDNYGDYYHLSKILYEHDFFHEALLNSKHYVKTEAQQQLYIYLLLRFFSLNTSHPSLYPQHLRQFLDDVIASWHLITQSNITLFYPPHYANLAAKNHHEAMRQFLFTQYDLSHDNEQKNSFAIALGKYFPIPAHHTITQTLLNIIDNRKSLRTEAIYALLHVPLEEAQVCLSKILLENTSCWQVNDVIAALTAISPPQAIALETAIIALLQHPKRDIRWHAILCLSQTNNYHVHFIKMLKHDKDTHIKGVVLTALLDDQSLPTQNTIFEYTKKILKTKKENPYLGVALAYLKQQHENHDIASFLNTLPESLLSTEISIESQLSASQIY